MVRLFFRLDFDQVAETVLRGLADHLISKLETIVSVPGVWEILTPSSAVFLKDSREVDVQIVELTIVLRFRVLH